MPCAYALSASMTKIFSSSRICAAGRAFGILIGIKKLPPCHDGILVPL